MTRGGARAGAGRKSPLNGFQALQVGQYCEALWIKAAEEQAHARYEALPQTKDIRAEQARADLIPLSRGKRRMNPDITESIDEITGGKRSISLPLMRPFGVKADIIKKAIDWCKSEFGQIISASKAVECWKNYKRFEKWAKDKGSLNST